MARQNINYGTNPNDGTGDNLRVAMDKINDNFIDLYSNISQTITVGNTSIVNTQLNANISIETSGTGTVQTTQGIRVNTNFQNSNSIFYAADGNNLLSIDVQNKRIGVNKATPTATLDVVGNAAFTGNLSAASNTTLGSSAADLITVNGTINGNLVPLNIHSLGSTSSRWNDLYVNNANLTTVNSTNITTTTLTATSISGNLLGQLTTNSSIRINNSSLTLQVNTETLTGARQINFPDRNGTVVTKHNNRIAGTFGSAPVTNVGIATDKQGDIAFDSDYIYYCVADYDGSSAIWKRAALASW